MIEFFRLVKKEISSPSSLLSRTIRPNLTVANIIVIAIMLMGAGLLLANVRTVGDGNAYYTAATESMLHSWKNFFFIAAEPGGGVSVDKPPLGLWVEALFALVFGVSGLSLSIPNLIAGVLEIPLLYLIVRKYMGELAGVVASLVLILTPVWVATHRHNTLDGMLTFTVLLATWHFVQATETGKLRPLLFGGFLIGIAFNIKMLQALLPVPAMIGLYVLGGNAGWLKKLYHLGLAIVLCSLVSLVWVAIVDSTPADQRPFVGSTKTNRVTELIFDYNAANRIFDPNALRTNDSDADQAEEALPPLPRFNGSGLTYQQRTGYPGVYRFFIPPLSRQLSWLLPFALACLLALLLGVRVVLPVTSVVTKSLILWGGWLVTCLVFFSVISGIFHPYYLMIGVPAFCATIGIGFAKMWEWIRNRKWTAVYLVFAAQITLYFQWVMLQQYKDRSNLIIFAEALFVLGCALLFVRRRSANLAILAGMLVIPAYWSLMTSFSSANQTFPSAYLGGAQPISLSYVANDPNLSANQRLLAYLQANTQDVEYLVAVPSAMQGMPLVLTSKRPVFYLGGFSGLDNVIKVDGLKEMVAKGELRYLLYAEFFRRPGGTGRGDPEILKWLRESCLVVSDFSEVIIYTRRPDRPDDLDDNGLLEDAILPGPRNDFLTLYLCP